MKRGARVPARHGRRKAAREFAVWAPIALAVVLWAGCSRPPAVTDSSGGVAESAPPVVRLTGAVEAVQSTAISVPRLQGPATPLLLVRLVKAGTHVQAGDLLVEFDRQQQERDAFDRRAELVNIVGEITKKRAEHAALDAKDQTELAAAEHDVARAELEVRTNPLIAAIDAEKNTLALEQAQARLAQLQATYTLKRAAAEADLRILEIRRARAERALGYAENNATLMVIRAPFSGLVVSKRLYRNGQFVEIAEGDEVRPGLPVLDIVDTSHMRVRAKINQADISSLRVGQRVKVGLDGFPELVFDGTIELVAPLATSSQLSEKVRAFSAMIAIDGTHPQLLPDLTAWIDVPVAAPTGTTARTDVEVP